MTLLRMEVVDKEFRQHLVIAANAELTLRNYVMGVPRIIWNHGYLTQCAAMGYHDIAT